MFKSENLAVLAILGALAANPAFAETKPAALVNGVAIPQARVDMRVKAAAAQGQADSPDLRKQIREDLINLEVMAQEATRLGVAKKPEVLQQIELARQSVLAGNYMQDYVKSSPITEDQIKQEYEKQKSKLGDKEYNTRHILVETEAEAKAIIAQLDKKAKFEKLATEKSKDSGSAARGGSLDWASPGSYVPPFANALKNLKKGEYTKSPVQSQFGWHIIRLEDVRDLKAPAYDEVKPQLQQRLQQQLVQKVIADLKAKAKIE